MSRRTPDKFLRGESPYDPAVPLLDVHHRETETVSMQNLALKCPQLLYLSYMSLNR